MVKNMRWEGKIYRHPNLQEFISGRYISITGSWVGRRANFRVCEAHSVSPSVQCTRSALCYARSMSRSRFREIWTNLRASGRRYQYAGDSRTFAHKTSVFARDRKVSRMKAKHFCEWTQLAFSYHLIFFSITISPYGLPITHFVFTCEK